MPRSTKELLKEAFLRGHAWNPKLPNLHNVDMGRVLLMDGSEKDAQDMLRSRQSIDAHFEPLMRAFHKRFPVRDQNDLFGDGKDGPALQLLVDMPRCSMPDYAPPPNASFDYGNADLNAAVKSYQEFAKTGRGSWPVGCDPNRPDVHSVVVAINTTAASAHQKSIMDEVLKYVEETEAEIGQAVRHVVNTDYASPQHQVSFQFIAGGVIGFAYFPRPDTCKQTVTARIDNSFDARPFVLAELLTHEYKGHSDGLEHSRGGIMNPSIGSPTTRASWRNDPHSKTKAGYFGGEPLGTGPGPIPDDPGTLPPQKVLLKAAQSGTVWEVLANMDFTAKKGEVVNRFSIKPYQGI